MLDISGPQMRKLLSILSFYIGIVYVIMNLQSASEVSSFALISNFKILPSWLYGAMFIVLGLAMYKTMNNRLCKIGRYVAAIGMTLYLFCWLANVAISNYDSMQVFYYPIISFFYLIEALSAK